MLDMNVKIKEVTNMAKNENAKCRKDIERLLHTEKQKPGEIISYIMQKYGLNYNSAQKRVARVRVKTSACVCDSTTPTAIKGKENSVVSEQALGMKAGEVATQETVYDGKKNETTFSGLVAIKPNANVDKEYLLKQYGLSPLEWTITGFRMSEWEAPQKGGSVANLQSFRLSVTPKKQSDYTIEEVQTIVDKHMDKVLSKYDTRIKNIIKAATKIKKTKKGLVVEILLPDIHVGLLAWRMETGEDFDLNIVVKQIKYAINQIYNKLIHMNIPIEKILLVTLGDVLHVDNDEQTTTKGTFQQVDGRFPKIVETAFDLLFDIITLFATIAPVEYVYIPGNHDRNTGWQLAFTLSKVFEKVDGVTCDCSPNPFKYRVINKVAIGWAHGDMNKKNIDNMMNMLTRELSGIILKFFHLGHQHNPNSHTSSDGGCIIEYFDSLCPASLWEHQQGYGKTPLRSIQALIHTGEPIPPDRIIGAVGTM
jgi:hypothetical protein